MERELWAMNFILYSPKLDLAEYRIHFFVNPPEGGIQLVFGAKEQGSREILVKSNQSIFYLTIAL